MEDTRVNGVNDLPISRAKIRELDNIRKKMADRVRHAALFNVFSRTRNQLRRLILENCNTYIV